jgi:hypothetical protein
MSSKIVGSSKGQKKVENIPAGLSAISFRFHVIADYTLRCM